MNKTNSAEVGIKSIEITLRGRKGSPLVIHAFAEKAKQEIRDKQQKKAKKARRSASRWKSAKPLSISTIRAASVPLLRQLRSPS